MKQYEYIELKNNTPCLSGIYFVLCLFHALFHCIYSVIAFFRPARRTHFFSHFPLTKLDENVTTPDAIIFILYGSKEKSPFLLYEKPLFYIQKGAFSIIMLREKNDAGKTGNDKMSLGNNPLQAKYACLR